MSEKAPEKPRYGQPCNGCGLCCAAEVCMLGKLALGKKAKAPCDMMRFEDGRFKCGLIMAEDDAISLIPTIHPLFREALGIGKGCDADD